MTLVPKKMGNKDFKYCFATRMFPLALIGVLFAKVIQMEKENGDWACDHVKLKLELHELEEKIKASDYVKLELVVHDLEEKIKALTSQN